MDTSKPPPTRNPQAAVSYATASDERLVELSLTEDPLALDTLLRRHQAGLYNLALRMLQQPQDAEEVTQESLLKIVTHLAMFRSESRFSTWAYRIAFNLIIDRKRSSPELAVESFNCYAHYLDNAVDEELGNEFGSAPERHLLVEEAKLSCLMGMLLCLDRRQRIVFLLGEMFDVSDVIGSEMLEISRDNFRQQLSRARRDLSAFMQDRCGLVDPRNACRCARKTRSFVRDGIVDPERLVFARAQYIRIQDISRRGLESFDRIVADTSTQLYQSLPFVNSPDLVSALRKSLSDDAFLSLLHLN